MPKLRRGHEAEIIHHSEGILFSGVLSKVDLHAKFEMCNFIRFTLCTFDIGYNVFVETHKFFQTPPLLRGLVGKL